jgi:hypothetical protein
VACGTPFEHFYSGCFCLFKESTDGGSRDAVGLGDLTQALVSSALLSLKLKHGPLTSHFSASSIGCFGSFPKRSVRLNLEGNTYAATNSRNELSTAL